MNFKKDGRVPFMHIARPETRSHLCLRSPGLPHPVAAANNGFNWTYSYKPEVRVVKRRVVPLGSAA